MPSLHARLVTISRLKDCNKGEERMSNGWEVPSRKIAKRSALEYSLKLQIPKTKSSDSPAVRGFIIQT